ncbi:MAG TPA: cytochrome P450 [Kofleriaceae bacterium]|nr:cytochrome P450 [Kofleriaceae bacterium]
MSIDLADPDTYTHGIPHDVFRQLRADDPISWRPDTIAGSFWAITRHRDAVAVLRDPETYSSWSGSVLLADPPPEFLVKLRESMMNSDPPAHTRLRRMINRALNPRRIERLESRIAEHAAMLVDRVRDRGSCDFAIDIAEEMPLFMICEILGVPIEDRRGLYALTMRMFSTLIQDPDEAMRDKLRAAADMRAYGSKLWQSKLASPTDDLATELAQAVEASMLTANEFEALFMLLFNAGTDTTRSLLCYGLDLLLDRPAVVDALRRDAGRIPSAIEEMLRCEPPVIQIRRTATRDAELSGVRIGHGDKVVVFFPSANRDESVFSEPDVFDIDRSPNDHIAFGYGTHHCLGAPLARLEAKHVFIQVLAKLSRLERRAPAVPLRTNFVRGMKSLEIQFAAT